MKKKHAEIITIGSRILQTWLRFILRWHSNHHWACNWNHSRGRNPLIPGRAREVNCGVGSSFYSHWRQWSDTEPWAVEQSSFSWRWQEMRGKSIQTVFKALLGLGTVITQRTSMNLHQIKRNGRRMVPPGHSQSTLHQSPCSLGSRSYRQKVDDACQGPWEGGMGSLKGTEVQFGVTKMFWRWMAVMVAQQCNCV